MYDHLEVKASKIPKAGKGLYTKRDIKKGERFVEYLGEIITDKECNKRAENDQYGYVFYINKQKCIDAHHTPEALARYANDAKGLVKIKGINNNSSYEVWKNRGWITAEKNIKAGSEIFVSYGAEYWRDIRYNIRLEIERKQREEKELS
ncbi:MAG: SET domain-containing protein [Bacteroidetes bacterium]|nr:SET domain-containing protein [Bacteroidota bacterium]